MTDEHLSLQAEAKKKAERELRQEPLCGIDRTMRQSARAGVIGMA
jgi:hypothetical protein